MSKVLEFIRRVSCELPDDIVKSLKKNRNDIIDTILENVELARAEKKPICQDTGTAIFYVEGDHDQVDWIREAMKKATEDIPLRPNSIHALKDETFGNIPVIHYTPSDRNRIRVMFKGGGSENVSSIYSLPDKRLSANRDLDGIRKVIMDAVINAQGKGCPPYIIGVCAGGTIEDVASASKKLLLRSIDDTETDTEKDILDDINKLGIGPMGLGGKPTALRVFYQEKERHPASFFVGISFGCWALRRGEY